MLKAAIDSVLAQTYENIEIIVVVDGEDAETEELLKSYGDPRLRYFTQPQSSGAPAARNRGFREARGEWIALLDDDDTWLPAKIERQLQRGEASANENVVVASAFVARSPTAEYVWPRVAPHRRDDISEYLMIRRGFFAGDRVIQTSTVMARRKLFGRLPYLEGLKKHQDWDWLLKAIRIHGAELDFLEEPLSVWNIEEPRDTISAKNNWPISLAWIESIEELVSPKAFSSFLLTYPGAVAARSADLSAFWPLLQKALQRSMPPVNIIVIYLGLWMFPIQLRRNIRSLIFAKPK
jgi:glycosyltransferase involved in cell wall biosynthesis